MHDTPSVGHASGRRDTSEHDGGQSSRAGKDETKPHEQAPGATAAGKRGMEPTSATTIAGAAATTADVEPTGNDAFPTTDGDDGNANLRDAAAAAATTAIPTADGHATWATATATTGVQRDAGTIRERATVWKPAHDVI